MPFLMVNSMSVINFIAKAFLVLVVIFMAVMLLFQEMDELREKRTRSVFRTEYALLGKRLVTAGNAYLKTQLTITFVTTCLCILGFIAIGNPYHVLLGITVGFWTPCRSLARGRCWCRGEFSCWRRGSG